VAYDCRLGQRFIRTADDLSNDWYAPILAACITRLKEMNTSSRLIVLLLKQAKPTNTIKEMNAAPAEFIELVGN